MSGFDVGQLINALALASAKAATAAAPAAAAAAAPTATMPVGPAPPAPIPAMPPAAPVTAPAPAAIMWPGGLVAGTGPCVPPAPATGRGRGGGKSAPVRRAPSSQGGRRHVVSKLSSSYHNIHVTPAPLIKTYLYVFGSITLTHLYWIACHCQIVVFLCST